MGFSYPLKFGKSEMSSELKTLKIDRTRLRTPKNYAVLKGVTVETVKNWIKSGTVNVEEIDGVKFIRL